MDGTGLPMGLNLSDLLLGLVRGGMLDNHNGVCEDGRCVRNHFELEQLTHK